jgi:hypothetical protein
MFSFSADDPGWGYASEKIPSNLYNEYGAWIAGFIIKELGLFSGLLIALVFLSCSLKFLKKYSFLRGLLTYYVVFMQQNLKIIHRKLI